MPSFRRCSGRGCGSPSSERASSSSTIRAVRVTELGAADDVAMTNGGRSRVYEIFNPDYSVGVACDHVGWIVGVHLGDEVWENTDMWLAAEIVRVARFAYLRSQVGRRAEMLANGVLPHVADSLGLPTEAEYQRQWQEEFGAGY